MSTGKISGAPLQKGAVNPIPNAPRSVEEWLASRRPGGGGAQSQGTQRPPSGLQAAPRAATPSALFKSTSSKKKHYVDAGAVWGFDDEGKTPIAAAVRAPPRDDSLSAHLQSFTIGGGKPGDGRPKVDSSAVWGFDQAPSAAAARGAPPLPTSGALPSFGGGGDNRHGMNQQPPFGHGGAQAGGWQAGSATDFAPPSAAMGMSSSFGSHFKKHGHPQLTTQAAPTQLGQLAAKPGYQGGAQPGYQGGAQPGYQFVPLGFGQPRGR